MWLAILIGIEEFQLMPLHSDEVSPIWTQAYMQYLWICNANLLSILDCRMVHHVLLTDTRPYFSFFYNLQLPMILWSVRCIVVFNLWPKLWKIPGSISWDFHLPTHLEEIRLAPKLTSIHIPPSCSVAQMWHDFKNMPISFLNVFNHINANTFEQEVLLEYYPADMHSSSEFCIVFTDSCVEHHALNCEMVLLWCLGIYKHTKLLVC